MHLINLAPPTHHLTCTIWLKYVTTFFNQNDCSFHWDWIKEELRVTLRWRVAVQCIPARRPNLFVATWCFSAFLRSPDGPGSMQGCVAKSYSWKSNSGLIKSITSPIQMFCVSNPFNVPGCRQKAACSSLCVQKGNRARITAKTGTYLTLLVLFYILFCNFTPT